MKRNTVLTTIAIVAIGITIFWLSQRDFVIDSSYGQKAEGLLIDQRYKWRKPKPPDTNIVLVGIETSSLTLGALNPEEVAASPTLQLMSQPYPWDRRVWAATLERLIGAGAKVVVFDFLFTSPSTKEGDEAFAKSIFNHLDQVVLASTFDYQTLEFQENRVEDQDKRTYRTYFPPASTLLPEGEEEAIGFATVWSDGDGVNRRGRYKTSQEREDPQLKKFADQYPDNLLHLTARAVQKFSGSVDTPPYGKNNFIDYQGSRGTYKPIPLENLFVDKLWNSPPLNGGTQFFQNKIVVVGPIANYFHDIKPTPFGEMPGPELQSQMLATLLSRSSLEETSSTYNTVVTFVMVIIALAICLLVSHAVAKGVLMLVMIAGFVAVCQYAFIKGNLVVSMTPPLFGFGATGLSVLVLQFFQEQAERRRVRKVLDRYVSKNIADLVLEDPRSLVDSLKGQKKFVPILFSDIRGFTGMTEGRDAEQLVKQLNEYFAEMVGVVLEEKGTLQKFIGDAIMAAWGDVISQGPQVDARHAVRTALRMREGLQKLNSIWNNQPDRTELNIGIGVNFGEVVVGNIGSPVRMEFTVLGDVVNFAARLESATKQFHCDIMVGESVVELTHDHFVFRKVGLITVKGKIKPVETFAVLSDRTKPEPEWLKLYHEGVDMFRRREFQKAIETFKIVLAQNGGQDFLCEMYIEWSTRYHRSPPPITWAGNFVLKDK